MSGNTLLALKTYRDLEHGNSLALVKVNVPSGEVTTTSFASGQLVYSNTAVQFNEADTTFLLYSVLREAVTTSRFQRRILVAQMDSGLQVKKPLTMLQLPFRSNVAAGFLLINGVQPQWLQVQSFFRVRAFGGRFPSPSLSNPYDPWNLRNYPVQPYGYESQIERNMPSAVHFAVVNNDFTGMKDSVAENRGSFYEVQPRPYGQFTLRKKAYLLMIENFSTKRHGLILFSGYETGLSTTNLPVFDRYDYMLPQVRAEKNYFILPYAHKREIGLIKITLDN